MKIPLKVFSSFEELRQDFEEEQAKRTPEERLVDVEFCRRQYALLKGLNPDEPLKKEIIEISDSEITKI